MSKNKKNRRKTDSKQISRHDETITDTSDKILLRIPSWFKDERLLGCFFFVIAFLAYLISLKNGFIWDDVEVIQKTYFRFDKSNYFSGFIPSEISDKKLLYYRPVLALSYIVDWNIWKLNPFGFHLTNTILYSLTVAAFYFAAVQFVKFYKVKKSLYFTITATLLFIFHPMHVESASWVSGRTDILCGLFFLLAFGFHIISYDRKYYLILSSITMALSLFSKEVAVAFPFLILGFDLVNGTFKRKDNILRYFFYFGILFLYLYLRSRSFVTIPDVYNNEIQASSQSIKDIVYFFNIFKVLVITYSYYVKQLVLPYTFNAFVTSLPTGIFYFVASFTVLLTITIIALYSYRKQEKIVTFSIYWIFLVIGPSALISIFAFIATPVAERYLFVPSAGYCLLIGYLILKISQHYDKSGVSLILAILIICSYAGFSISRQMVWRDRVSFWKDTSSKSIDHAIPHINYGMALLDAGNMEEAIKEFHISLKPEMNNTPTGRAIAANNLGVAYINGENYTAAAKSLLIALESDPNFHKTYYHFGLLYYIKANASNNREDYMTSEKYLLQAVSLYNKYGKALLLLAKLHAVLGDTDKSQYYARQALNSGLVDELASQAQRILTNEK